MAEIDLNYNKKKKTLYKYFPASDYSLSSLKAKSHWYSLPTSLNDPFEFQLAIPDNTSDIIGFDIARNQNPHLHYLSDEEFLDELIFTYQNQINHYGITSFSETNDNLLMWAHYANWHTGFCLTFDFQEDAAVYPVNYTDDYPVLNFQNVLHVEGLYKILLTKSTCWAYEREWRSIQVPVSGTYPRLVPYNGALTEIILGARISEDNEKLLITIAKEFGIVVKKCLIHGNRYELAIETLSPTLV